MRMENGAVRSKDCRPRAGRDPMAWAASCDGVTPRACAGVTVLVAKDRRVLLLDLGHLRELALRVVRQQLDLAERRAFRRLLRVRMQRALAARVDDELLDLRR